MKFGFDINANELPPEPPFDPIPAGTYTAVISSAELKMTKAGTGQYIALAHTITGPTHEGRVVFANVNIRNDNPKAQEFGLAQLRSIMSAAGLAVISDTDQLIGVNVQIKVKVRPARDGYDASNDVSAWAPIGSTPAVASAPSAPTSAPAAQKPNTPPWAK